MNRSQLAFDTEEPIDLNVDDDVPYEAVVARLAEAATDRFALACFIDAVEDRTLVRRAVATFDIQLPAAHVAMAPHADAVEGAAVVMRTGRSRYYGRGWLAALARDDSTIAALGTVPIRSIAFSPLKFGSTALGVITFVLDFENDVAQREELERFARDAGIALGCALMRDRRRTAERRAEATELRLGYLARSGAAFSSSLDLPTAMQHFLSANVGSFADGAALTIDTGGPQRATFAHGILDLEAATNFGLLAIHLGRAVFQEEAHVIAAPVVTGETITGAVIFRRGRQRPPFDLDDMTLVDVYAARIASYAVVAANYARELRISRTLQTALRPRSIPAIAGMTIVASYLPGEEGMDVGGDWYDVIVIDGERIAFVIGDVMGHDVEAASTMAQLRSGIRATLYAGIGPAACLKNADRLLAEISSGSMYATAILAVFDTTTNVLTIANAGHPPAFVLRDGVLSGGQRPAIMLGIEQGTDRLETTAIVAPGDIVAFYTDGVFEDRDRPYVDGFAALEAALSRARDIEGAKQTILALAPRSSDDRTLLLFTLDS